MKSQHWSGYLHQSGIIHLKKWVEREDIKVLEKAKKSLYVLFVVKPFAAKDEKEAKRKIVTKLNKEGFGKRLLFIRVTRILGMKRKEE